MDSQNKIRAAFKKVKSEMSNLNQDIATLRMQVASATRDGAREGLVTKTDVSQEIRDLENEIDRLNNTVLELKTSSSKDDVGKLNMKIDDISELLTEKINLEVNSLRLEVMEQVATVFDNISKELDSREDKNEKKANKQKSRVKNIEESNLLDDGDDYGNEPKKGRFKKAVEWLFVDDENDEFEDIKVEVKKDKKSKNN